MSRLQLIDTLSHEEEKKWRMLGWVTIVLTFTLSFNFAYERFFERRLYLNRRLLGDYIEENGVPEPVKSALGNYKFIIDGYEITLQPNNEWYVFKGGTLNCIMSGFKGDTGARKEYAYIQRKLVEKARGIK